MPGMVAEYSGEATLAGLCVAVVGAGSGLGMTVARRLLKAGARVAAFEQLDVSLQGLQPGQQGAALHLAYLDVSDPQAVVLAMTAAERMLGPIGRLVCALDVRAPGRLVDMASAQWRQAFDANVMGTFHFSQIAARQMSARRQGVIVNLSDDGGAETHLGMGAYAASMAAVSQLTRGLAAELAAQGVRCHHVAAGRGDGAASTVLRLLSEPRQAWR